MPKTCLFVLLVTLILGFGGCQAEPARFQIHVFDAYTSDVDSLVPAQDRKPIADSPFTVATIYDSSAVALTRLATDMCYQQIVDSDGWNAQAISYSHDDNRGDIVGSVILKKQDDAREVQIHCDVHHWVAHMTDNKGIDSHVAYEGKPTHRAVIFVAPISRTEGRPLSHVLIFSIYSQ